MNSLYEKPEKKATRLERTSCFRKFGNHSDPMVVEFYADGKQIGSIWSLRPDRYRRNDWFKATPQLAQSLGAEPEYADTNICTFDSWAMAIKDHYGVSTIRINDSYLMKNDK